MFRFRLLVLFWPFGFLRVSGFSGIVKWLCGDSDGGADNSPLYRDSLVGVSGGFLAVVACLTPRSCLGYALAERLFRSTWLEMSWWIPRFTATARLEPS